MVEITCSSPTVKEGFPKFNGKVQVGIRTFDFGHWTRTLVDIALWASDIRQMKVEPVKLTGIHVRLEPLSLAHLNQLCEIGLEPELWRWTTSRIATCEDMRAYVQTALHDQSSGTALPFVTVAVDTGRVVGSTRFGNIDRVNRRVEIGWTWVGTPWQRTAVNTEAKLLMLRHAFETLGCIRVEFKTDSLNDRSRKALLRIGAREEGILRNHMVVWDGRYRHSVYFSVIDNEWPEVRLRLEALLGSPRGTTAT